ncbi:MAG: helix-turn-helix domain-containing protein [Actinomycetota bacterium]
MAGNRLRPTAIGVGSALRRARAIRGTTLDEAARDTKLRPEQLQALEDEDFGLLGGEVYVRATLRTYAEYLGLNAEKVSAAYARYAEDPEPPVPPSKLGKVERAIAATRVRDSQRFLLIAAAVVLISLVAVGLVSRRSVPVPAVIATATPPPSFEPVTTAGAPVIDVVLTATADVDVSAIADGEPIDPVHLRAGAIATFQASQILRVTASDGGAVDVNVNGVDRGAPGPIGQPWTKTFSHPRPPASPSPTASRSDVTASPSG